MVKTGLGGRLEAALESLHVPRDAAMVVAVSGGADSVALLHLLCGLNGAAEKRWSLRLHVAHLNHRIRGGEADADAEFVKALAHALHLPSTIESIDVPGRCVREGGSLEQVGRVCRFEFFERVCLQTGAELVALAHQADDQAETILHRVVRGTGVRGLVGIRPSRPIRPGSTIRVIRPMLSLRRSEIEGYLQSGGIAYRRDATNETGNYTRCAIRRELMPLIESRFNPQAAEALLRLGEQAADLDAYLEELAEKALPPLILEATTEQLTLDCDALERRPRVIRSYFLRQAIRRLGVPEGDISYDHLTRVVALAEERSGSKTLHLPGGLHVTRAYGRLKLSRVGRTDFSSDGEAQHIAVEGISLMPGKGLEITSELLTEPEQIERARAAAQQRRVDAAARSELQGEEWLDADRVQPPLLARGRTDGDRFCPLGMTGMKKISDFLIDQKVPADQRDQIVLLCDQSGPIWVVPLRIDDRVRLREETRRVLHVIVRAMEQ